MVQGCQRPGIIQSDAGTLRFALLAGTVEPLENLFEIFFGDAAARVGNGDTGILVVRIFFRQGKEIRQIFTRKHVEGQSHLSAGRRVLHGVGQQVHRDFLHFVDVGPHHERLLQTLCAQLDIL